MKNLINEVKNMKTTLLKHNKKLTKLKDNF